MSFGRIVGLIINLINFLNINLIGLLMGPIGDLILEPMLYHVVEYHWIRSPSHFMSYM